MKTFYKVLISFSIGLCLIFAGISLGGLNDLSSIGFLKHIDLKWNYHSIDDVHFQATSNVKQLNIEVHQGNVEIHRRSDMTTIQISAQQIYSGFKIYQKDDKLIIDQPHYWWFHRPDNAKIDIYIPENLILDKIDIDMAAGYAKIENVKANKIDINAAAGVLSMNRVECEKLDLDASMGNTSIRNLTAKKIDVDTSMGNVKMILTGHEDDYSYDVNVGLGSVSIGNEKFSGVADKKSNHSDRDKKIDVSCGLGNVNIEMEGSL